MIEKLSMSPSASSAPRDTIRLAPSRIDKAPGSVIVGARLGIETAPPPPPPPQEAIKTDKNTSNTDRTIINPF